MRDVSKTLSLWIVFAIFFAAGALIWQKANAMTVRPQNVARLTAIKQHIGLHERKNRSTIRRIVGVDPARTKWCGAAVAYAVRKAGGKPVRHPLRAYNWQSFGHRVSSIRSAQKGDIIVYRHSHVAVFSHRTKGGRHVACGGNMSNRFKCSNYRNSSVKAVRR